MLVNEIYQYRRLGAEDLADAMQLARDTFLKFEAPDYSEEGIREFQDFIDLTSITEKLIRSELLFWGCFDQTGIVGVIAMRDPCHITLLFVHEDHQRRGIARSLFKTVLEYNESRDKTLTVTVNSSPYATEAYRHLGFVETDTEQLVKGIRFTPMKLSHSHSQGGISCLKTFEPVLDVKDIIALEKRIEAQGTSLLELMEQAGLSVAQFIRERVDAPTTITIFCGTGNNGGDGWVVADLLCTWGYDVSLVTMLSADNLSVEPARSAALEVAAKKHAGLHAKLSIHVDPCEEQLIAMIQASALIVDAVLGTGFSVTSGSELKEPYRMWFEMINSSRAARHDLIVVAVDVPSGLDAQSGAAADHTVAADTTITMLAYKPGLILEHNNKYTGDIILAQIAPINT